MTKARRSRRLSLIALFTALAIILNLAFSFPAPFADFLFYEVWEIPIVLAFLLLGLRSGVTVAFLNTIVLELVKPGATPTGPLYNFIPVLGMFAGILLAQRLVKGRRWGVVTLVAVSTSLGVATRTAVSTIMNAIILPLPYPLGIGATASQVPALLVLSGFFNITVAIYTIPLAYSLQRAIATRYRLNLSYTDI